MTELQKAKYQAEAAHMLIAALSKEWGTRQGDDEDYRQATGGLWDSIEDYYRPYRDMFVHELIAAKPADWDQKAWEDYLDTYVSECEHQDGEAYWLEFTDVQAAVADVLLCKQNEEEM